MTPGDRRSFRLVLLAAALLYVVRLGSVPLFDPDEARFARTSLEMARTGDLVVPTFEGRPRLQKPPLLHWLQGALFSAVGPREWAARLPAALATLAAIALAGLVARRRFGEEAASWTAAVLATIPLVLVGGRVGTTDALLALHVFAFVALDLAAPEERTSARPLLAGAFLGLAFLAKGPVGVALPVLAVVAGRTAAAREVWPGGRAVLLAAGSCLAVALPWTLALLASVGTERVLDLLRIEIVGRVAEGTAHGKPWWYYGAVLPIAAFPWSLPALAGLARAAGSWRDPASRTARYAGAAILAGVVFLSFSRGKLPSYALPLAPLVALVVTWEAGHAFSRPERKTAGSLGLAIGLLAGAVVFALAPARFDAVPRSIGLALGAVYLVGALAALWALVRGRPRLLWSSAVAVQVTVVAVAAWVVPSLLSERRSAADLVEAYPRIRGERPLLVVEIELPSLTLYADRVPERFLAHEVEARLDDPDRPLLVTADVDWDRLPPSARERLSEIGRKGKLVLAEERK